MAEELQSLLEKINVEGVKKAQAERDAIIAAAKQEAERIVSAARAEAEAERKLAADESAALRLRAESAIRQASRDILLKLENELKDRIVRAVSGAAGAALTVDFMAGLIRELAAKFAASPDSELTVLAAVKDAAALESALRSALADSFKTAPRVLAEPGIAGGMEVSFKDGELYFDFTLEAVTELVAAYAGSMIAGLIRDQQ